MCVWTCLKFSICTDIWGSSCQSCSFTKHNWFCACLRDLHWEFLECFYICPWILTFIGLLWRESGEKKKRQSFRLDSQFKETYWPTWRQSQDFKKCFDSVAVICFDLQSTQMLTPKTDISDLWLRTPSKLCYVTFFTVNCVVATFQCVHSWLSCTITRLATLHKHNIFLESIDILPTQNVPWNGLCLASEQPHH